MRVLQMTEQVLSIKDIKERQENLEHFFSFYNENSELETLHNQLKTYLEKAEEDISDTQDDAE